MEIIDKLEDIKTKWETLGEQLNDPEIIGDMKRFVKINKDYKELEPIVAAFKEYKNLLETGLQASVHPSGCQPGQGCGSN